ncbi:ATPase [Enterococcus thailandicus]|uniref:N-acetylglucosamine kinase n=1 Tax=Enterococcus TaxID=1350 RepID=UPI000BAE74FF|nr:BadF/BadG/BcrA/BcrD ATPase family protein [Enterococcus thailandicus]ASZ08050.1 hypothetical protein CK496_09055 [Enterococcus thailandicus]MDT2845896.1 BadF/BadG/BcrA/BcrD ATPase family protein [Enterococcus thailandicus]GMC02855.1 ATPase [Enterococcus thailandicus]GMC08662.1 ATPase [Enterococcus thailandicus]
MKYVIGIDCGGTKTQAIAYDLEENVLGEAIEGFGNLLISYEQAKANIFRAIDDLLTKFGRADCQLIALGIAGIDGGGLREKIQNELAYYDYPVYLYNDAQFSYLAKVGFQPGILAIAGTGSAFFGLKEKQWYRVGGWGQLLGDEGSAYHLAIAAIKLVLAEFDEGKTLSPFAQDLLAFFGAEDVMSLVKIIYQKNKGEIASVASFCSSYEQKDARVSELLKQTGELLAKQVTQLAKKMKLTTGFYLGINGSLLEKQATVRQVFLEQLKSYEVVLTTDTVQNAKAALVIWKNQLAAQSISTANFR